MPDYKAMYMLVAKQSIVAAQLLHEAQLDKIYQAIDILENAHKDTEALYMNAVQERDVLFNKT